MKSAPRLPYWHRVLWLTGLLLAVWFITTFLTCLFAPALNARNFMGFPLGFYFAAQGSLIVYLAIVGLYAWSMNGLDTAVQSEEQDSASL